MKWVYANSAIVSQIIPCLILFMITVLILIKLRSVRERKVALNTATDGTDRTSKALLAILILFLICELPISIVLILHIINPKVFYIVLTNVATFSFMTRLLNASLNLILYCFMSTLFRATFKEIFFKRISKLKPQINFSMGKNTESIEMS